MKIVYLHQYYTTTREAGGTRSFEAARRLVRWGHEVELITSDRSQASGRGGWIVTNEEGVRVHRIAVPYSNNMGYARRIVAFVKFAVLSTRRAIAIRDADVIFATSTPLTIALPAVVASKRLRIPYVLEVRDLWPEVPIAIGALRNPIVKALASALERFAYRHAAHVVALSPDMAEGVAAKGFPTKKIHTIPNAADLDIFRPDVEKAKAFLEKNPTLKGRRFVLYAGTIGLVNGVQYIVNLCRAGLSKGSELAFVVVGDGQEYDAVNSLAVQLSVLNRNFFMIPPVSKVELAGAFSAAGASMSVVIDLKELEANSANKFFDGLAAGRPVFINHGGWQKAILEEYGAGASLSRDPEQAFDEIEAVLSDPALTSRMGESARRLAESRFARDDLVRKLEAVLAEAGSST